MTLLDFLQHWIPGIPDSQLKHNLKNYGRVCEQRAKRCTRNRVTEDRKIVAEPGEKLRKAYLHLLLLG
jgi:hypothetical protein